VKKKDGAKRICWRWILYAWELAARSQEEGRGEEIVKTKLVSVE